ncbi:MAG: serine/threonine protein kinase [Verrucomicrobiales bacterium]|nr:serine/threonine protein kinase [Verrucomicrobiales bacterium]
MSALPRCSACGGWLDERALEGLCPACVTRTTLIEVTAAGQPGAPRPFTAVQPPEEAVSRDPEAGKFGDYHLEVELGRGGMGVVYRARQASLNRVVALKLLPPGPFASEELVVRFRAEAQAAAALQHPHIVRIHEVGQHQGQHYFSMDLIQGRSLAEVGAGSALAPTAAARYVRLAAEAIHYAHGQGVLHRDLKPSNILIAADDTPRITDFGLAKRLSAESDVTLSGQVLGSPGYLSPEQAAGTRGMVGVASDVYGLGAVLYHLLTGVPPFQADNLSELLRAVIEEEPVPVRTRNRAVPRDLETVCLTCLRKQPATRYASAQALAEDLARWEAGRPVRARPTGLAGRLFRWGRRQPVPATAVVTLAVAALPFAGSLGLHRLGVWRLERANEHVYIRVGHDLFRTDPLGRTWQPLPIQGMHVDVSPDGRRLGYVRLGRVYVSRLDGSGERQVAGDAADVRWLDRDTVLYEPTDLTGVWAVDVHTCVRRQLFDWKAITPHGIHGGLSLSPDRSRFAANPQNGFDVPTQDVLVCDLRGSSVGTVWADTPDTTMDACPVWLGGERVVWCRFARPGVDVSETAIVAARVGDTHYETLTEWGDIQYPVAASPDGSRILFVKTFPGDDGHLEFWIMDADGGNARRFLDRTFPRGGLGILGACWWARSPE